MQEQELFQGYELKGWELNQRISKILGASTLVSLLSLFAIGQSELLTTKGCDSPFVGQVCNVLDTVYVGSNIIATDAGYVDQDYTPNELADADITFIDVSSQFKYPEGYFALSNPELQNPTTMFDANGNPIPGATYLPDGSGSLGGIPPTTAGGTNDLLNKPQELPKPNDSAVVGTLPDSPFTIGPNPTVPTPRVRTPRTRKQPQNPTLSNTSPELPKLPNDETTAQNDANKNPQPNGNQPDTKSGPVPEVEINKKPLKDFAANVKAKYEKKEIDLTQTFSITAEGVITNDGKLDTTVDPKTKQPKSRFVKWEGNQQMVDVAKEAFEAVGNSGWLAYLRSQNIDKINFTITQDNETLKVIITSDQPSTAHANSVSSGFNGLIQGALLLDKNGIKKLGNDEKVLLNSAKASATGNQFVLNFALPKTTAQEMITRKLAEPETTENKPQSTAAAAGGNQTAAK